VECSREPRPTKIRTCGFNQLQGPILIASQGGVREAEMSMAKQPHFDGAKDEITVIEITSEGPATMTAAEEK
jgi:hypothetical protein